MIDGMNLRTKNLLLAAVIGGIALGLYLSAIKMLIF